VIAATARAKTLRETQGELMSELPVVCTLGPEALAARRQGLLAELLRRAETHSELPDGHRLSFAATDETLAIILKTVGAERHCCQFLRFQITVEAGGGPISLELTGPPGTREFVSALLES
jgi:hypothetical protein